MSTEETGCPNCDGDRFSWSLSTRLSSSAPLDGQLNSHDVIPILVLGCDDCSETIRIVEGDQIVNELMRRRVVVVPVPDWRKS